jgi:hypothetical protein
MCGLGYVLNIEGYGSSGTAVDDLSLPPLDVALYGGRPNPFASTTTISYRLAESERVSLHIYDAGGRLVRALVRGVSQPAGDQSIVWDGKDALGEEMGSGVYFYRVTVGPRHEVGQLLLLK